MSEFVNRVASDLNKRTLKVMDTRLKGNGEIDELDVELVRMDGTVTKEGTPLDAEKLNEIVISLVKEMVGETALTNAERVALDKEALSVPSEATSDFTVETTGNNGTTITWTDGGSGLSVNGSEVTVTQTSTEQTGYLYATVIKGTARATRTFTVTIPALEGVDTEEPGTGGNGSNEEEVTFTTSYSSDSLNLSWEAGMEGNSSGIIFSADNGNGINVDVTADDSSYEDYFDINVQNNGGTTVLVDIMENVGNMPIQSGTYTFTVEVVNNNNETLSGCTIIISY